MRKQNAKSLALSHVAAVRAYDDQLETELARPRVDHDTVKTLNAHIGVGLKLAEVHASLAIAEALEDLAEATSAPLDVTTTHLEHGTGNPW